MKFLKKIVKLLFPVFLGLLIYITIRAITDTADKSNHLGVGAKVLAIELLCSIIAGYFYVFLIRFFTKKMHVTKNKLLTAGSVIKEYFLFYVYVLLITNVTFTVVVSLTDDGLDWHDFVMINTIPVFYNFIIISIMRGNHYINAYIKNKIQLERLARDKAEEELKFLKGQYQPHFLFNALNTIYFQMDESVEGAKSSIEKLSELLRYRLYDDDSAKVLLSKEIEYLEKYIQFQKIRSSEKLKINIDFGSKINNQSIYPFLFLPLVENAFKYVSGEMWINIQLRASDENVDFEVSNSIDNELFNNYRNGGIGLQNLEKRLQLLYNNEFNFNVSTTNNAHLAHLQINLQDN